ncbi:efflux RND transporter periplasmic adaptor subunit [Leptolyngbya sp. Cla-17]|uniref:efflux RND transporter periplasmic adaptor subunit n=1 Tax=Leptolyngbya sp. Cla-17 TaxID=2803751 RepID=UPI0018D9E008|nr:efflux RND transporter periplasmic adaptor subunit [Leptolyngbya sp. Cla-17]
MKDLKKLGVPKWLITLLVLGLLAGIGYVVFTQMTAANPKESRRRGRAVAVEQVNLPVTISANGTVQPERSVNVSPKTSGKLKELLVKEGDRVEQGQILAYMDDSNFQGQLTQARGQVESAQANLQRLLAGNRTQDIAQAQARVRDAEALVRKTEQTLQQNQRLFNTGAISQRELNNSLADRDSAIAQLTLNKQALSLQQAGSRPEEIAEASAQVTTAEGSLQTVQIQIADAVIRAPFSGVVTKKFADPGAFVTPTTSGSAVSSATSSSILSLASNNQIMANVAESNIAQIKLGQSVEIKVDAYPGKIFTGKVIQLATQSTTVQNVTSFEVKSSIADPSKLLRAGMSVDVDFKVGTLSDVLVIPTVAIVRQEGASGVLVMGREGGDRRSEFRPITTGVSVTDKTVVLSGLQVGDRVMLSFAQGERPQSRTPSMLPGMGGGGGSGGSRQR